jgi:hypothetical protein
MPRARAIGASRASRGDDRPGRAVRLRVRGWPAALGRRARRRRLALTRRAPVGVDDVAVLTEDRTDRAAHDARSPGAAVTAHAGSAGPGTARRAATTAGAPGSSGARRAGGARSAPDADHAGDACRSRAARASGAAHGSSAAHGSGAAGRASAAALVTRRAGRAAAARAPAVRHQRDRAAADAQSHECNRRDRARALRPRPHSDATGVHEHVGQPLGGTAVCGWALCITGHAMAGQT